MKDTLVRTLFNVCMKDKHLKRLARRYWPVMITEIEGNVFHLRPIDNTTERHLYVKREFAEVQSLAFLTSRMKGRPCLFIDIGANCGAYTVPLARCTGRGSVVHAFEPSPVMMPRLRTNLDANHLTETVKTHKVALSSTTGMATLHVHTSNHGQSSLIRQEQSTESIQIEQHELASYVPEKLEVELFVIKIDVEGAEDDVLYPFLSSAEAHRLPDIILIETVHEDHWEQNLRELFFERGYQIAFEGEGNTAFVRERLKQAH